LTDCDMLTVVVGVHLHAVGARYRRSPSWCHVGAGARAGLEDIDGEWSSWAAVGVSPAAANDRVRPFPVPAIRGPLFHLREGGLQQALAQTDLGAPPDPGPRSGSSPLRAGFAPATTLLPVPGPRPWCRAQCGIPCPQAVGHKSGTSLRWGSLGICRPCLFGGLGQGIGRGAVTGEVDGGVFVELREPVVGVDHPGRCPTSSASRSTGWCSHRGSSAPP